MSINVKWLLEIPSENCGDKLQYCDSNQKMLNALFGLFLAKKSN